MEKIKIIYEPQEDNPFLVIYKPKALASAPLSKDDKNNALAQALELFPQIKNVKGKKEIEYGLLHRLDTVTDGLLMIATEQNFYDYLIEEQKNGHFIKTYQALCNYNPRDDVNEMQAKDGFPPYHTKPIFEGQKFTMSSYFRYFGKGNKEVRPVTKESGKKILEKAGKLKEYTTNVFIKKKIDKDFLVECSITQGFKHQVRCHLAWSGLPIINDCVYNKKNKTINDNEEKSIKFTATKIEFEYPLGKKHIFEL